MPFDAKGRLNSGNEELGSTSGSVVSRARSTATPLRPCRRGMQYTLRPIRSRRPPETKTFDLPDAVAELNRCARAPRRAALCELI